MRRITRKHDIFSTLLSITISIIGLATILTNDICKLLLQVKAQSVIMGISGLLPLLKSVIDEINVSKYSGKTVGIDASGWLYKGAYSCAQDLVLSQHTDMYQNALLDKLAPLFVFDGAPIPAKRDVHAARHRSRELWKQRALSSTDHSSKSSRRAFAQAIVVTDDMKLRLIHVLKKMDVQFIVAPYEADAQLAFLSRMRIVDAVISEDSDCIAYGCRTILLKWNGDGWTSELKKRSLGANEDLSFVDWTDEMFITFCALCGCDYCPSVPGVGTITAYKYINAYSSPVNVLEALKKSKAKQLPPDYESKFYTAILTYRHHLVFDPRTEKLRLLNSLEQSEELVKKVGSELHFLGDISMQHEVAASIAKAYVHPVTHETYSWMHVTSTIDKDGKRKDSKVDHYQYISDKEGTSSYGTTESENDAQSIQKEQSSDFVSTYTSHDDTGLGSAYSKTELYESTKKHFSPNLESLLGPSAHFLNFKSPKVSDNFISLVTQDRGHHKQGRKADLKQYENLRVKTIKRSRHTTTNRSEYASRSGFVGEVQCNVDEANKDTISTRPRLIVPLLTGGTAFARALPSCKFETKPQKHTSTSDDSDRIQVNEARSFSVQSGAMCAEEKWDRILCLDEDV